MSLTLQPNYNFFFSRESSILILFPFFPFLMNTHFLIPNILLNLNFSEISMISYCQIQRSVIFPHLILLNRICREDNLGFLKYVPIWLLRHHSFLILLNIKCPRIRITSLDVQSLNWAHTNLFFLITHSLPILFQFGKYQLNSSGWLGYKMIFFFGFLISYGIFISLQDLLQVLYKTLISSSLILTLIPKLLLSFIRKVVHFPDDRINNWKILEIESYN